MRPVREITADEENFRTELTENKKFQVIRRDPIEPEPVGTIVIKAFRVTGYDQDCDGSLMSRLEQIDSDGLPTGWEPTNLGLRHTADLVVSLREWQSMFQPPESP